MKILHYYKEKDFSVENKNKLEDVFKKIDSKYTTKAAVGEGSGGSGFETIVEVLIQNPIIGGIIAAGFYDTIRYLINKLKKIEFIKKKTPPEIAKKRSIRLTIYSKLIIGIDIKQEYDAKKIVDELKDEIPKAIKSKKTRMYYIEGKWKIY